MRVLLTGASGFVGSALLPELLSRGHEVAALVRPALRPDSHAGLPKHPNLSVHPGDLSDPSALTTAAQGCEAAIHLVGIIRETGPSTFQSVHVEGTRNVLTACQSAGVRRYIHMSALGTRANAVAPYHQTKYAAEQLVRQSPLDWTILRPGLILSTPASPQPGELTDMVRGWAQGKKVPWFFFPYFRPGLLGLGVPTQVTPVPLAAVSRAFAEALTNDAAIRQTYDLSTPDPLTWPQLYQLICTLHHLTPKPALPIPVWYAKLLTYLLPANLLPFTRSQVQMAAEDSIGDPKPFEKDFGWKPFV